MILTAAVLSQYTRITDRQTNRRHYDNSRTLHCNGRLTNDDDDDDDDDDVFVRFTAEVPKDTTVTKHFA